MDTTHEEAEVIFSVRYQTALDIEKTDDKHAEIIDNFTGCKYIVWM